MKDLRQAPGAQEAVNKPGKNGLGLLRNILMFGAVLGGLAWMHAGAPAPDVLSAASGYSASR
jgi:hypothetical protein